MAEPKCSIAECGAKHHARGLCLKHYRRVQRHGHAGEAASLRMRAAGVPCSAPDCQREATALGFCNMHYKRFAKHGSVDVTIKPMTPRGAHEVEYGPIHQRVRDAKGPARDHACVACSGRAQQWAYNHSGHEERISAVNGMVYSLDIASYQPMCIPCHRRLDAR